MPTDSTQTRSAILDAAEAQFAAKGFAAASMSEIAAKSKVSKSLLHHHFGSKEGLWSAVKERRFGEFWSQQAGLVESLPTGPEMLDLSVKTYFQFLSANPDFVRLLMWHFLEQEALEGKVAPTGAAEVAATVKKLRQAQQAGHVREDIDPRNLMIMFFSLVVHWHEAKSLYLSWVGQPANQTAAAADKAYLKDMLKVFLRGVSPSGG